MSLFRKRIFKPGWIILILLFIYLFKNFLFDNSFEFNKKIIIEKGDTIQKIINDLPTLSKTKVRWYIKNNESQIKSLQLGAYTFSGNYTPETFVKLINDGPKRSFSKIRILEGWSIYDIDEYLSGLGYISPGEYITYVSNEDKIISLSQKYKFINLFINSKPQNNAQLTLEGLLYPDTYHINENQPLIEQLVDLQLDAFNDKVFTNLENEFLEFSNNLKSQGYTFSLGFYNIITISSIVEKEERYNPNKPLIAGIFFNRIEKGMRIDADITLCYGLKKGYEICTPTLIARSISDDNNIYNTRRKSGLTPTPIANPSLETISSVLNYKKSDNVFYLHDKNGKIWVAETLEGHNINKNNYL